MSSATGSTSQPHDPASFRRNVAGALAVAVFAVLVRLAHLSDTAMWDDESFRFDLATGDRTHVSMGHAPWKEVWDFDPAHPFQLSTYANSLRMLKNDAPYPPGYYLVLHTLMRLGVTEPRHLRVFNALCGGVIAACLFLMGRRRLSAAGAAGAAVLFALSGWDLGISMQLKETALGTALGFASTTVFLWALDGAGWWRWLFSGALLGAAVLSQQQAVYFGLIQVALFFSSPRPWRELGRRAIAGWALGAALVMPWVIWAGPTQLAHLRGVNQQFGGQWSGFSGLPAILELYLGSSLAPLGPDVLRGGWFVVLVAGTALVSVVAFTVARHRGRPVGPTLEIAALGGFIWLGGLACSLLVYVLMRQNQSLWARYSPVFLPAAWLVFAAGFDRLSARFGGGGLPVVFAGLLGLLFLPRPLDPLPLDRYGDWSAATRALRDEVVDGDLIVHAPGSNAIDAFLHVWSHRTRHVVAVEFSDELVDELKRQSRGRPVWMVFAWGFNSQLPKYDEAFARDGWTRKDLPSGADLPVLFERMPPGRIFPDAFTVVGFVPPAPAP